MQRLGQMARVLLVVSLFAACKLVDDTRPIDGPLANLAIPPRELPSSCKLYWKNRPLALSTTPEEERDYFALLAGFWVGKDHNLNPEHLDIGLSNIYATRWDDNAVVVFVARFKNPDAAAAAVHAVKSQHEGDSRYWWRQEGLYAIFASSNGGIEAGCFEAIRSGTVKRVKEL